MEDQQFAERIRRTRARAHNLELDGFPARMRDIAVELLQTSLVSLERGLQREEFEGVEADEHLDNYNASHQALAQAVGRVMRELRIAQRGATRTTDPTRNATKNSTGKGGDTFPLPHETLWSEYLSTDVMQTLLGVDELTLHEYRWASGVFGWLRCKELYGDGSRDIVYAWSVLLDRVLGA